jgi:hypothetical protein
MARTLATAPQPSRTAIGASHFQKPPSIHIHLPTIIFIPRLYHPPAKRKNGTRSTVLAPSLTEASRDVLSNVACLDATPMAYDPNFAPFPGLSISTSALSAASAREQAVKTAPNSAGAENT